MTPPDATLADRTWPFSKGQTVALFGILAALEAWLAFAASHDPVLFVGAALFALACYVSFRSTIAGLSILILFQLRVLQGTAEISAEEVAYAVLFLATIVGWSAREARSDAGRRVLRSPLGRSLGVFLALCVVSLVVTIAFGGSPLWWLRDLVRFSYFLLFFPIATTLRTRREVAIIGACLLAVVLFHGVSTIYWYGKAVAATRALWQLRYQRVALHEVFAMSALVGAFALFLKTRSRAVAALSIGLAIVCLVSLAASLTRGYWLAAVVAAALTYLLAKGRPSRAALFTAALLSFLAVVAVGFFSTKIIGVVGSLVDRISTISSPLRVLSMRERFAETRALLEGIRRSPVVGHGLGATVSYMSPLRGHVMTRTYAHNAYLFIWFKLGLVGLVSFLVFYVRGILATLAALRVVSDQNARALLAAGAALLLAFLPLSVTSPQYYGKSSALVIVLILGFAQAALLRRRDSSAEGGDDVPPSGS